MASWASPYQASNPHASTSSVQEASGKRPSPTAQACGEGRFPHLTGLCHSAAPHTPPSSPLASPHPPAPSPTARAWGEGEPSAPHMLLPHPLSPKAGEGWRSRGEGNSPPCLASLAIMQGAGVRATTHTWHRPARGLCVGMGPCCRPDVLRIPIRSATMARAAALRRCASRASALMQYGVFSGGRS